jgi:hypothetical protein
MFIPCSTTAAAAATRHGLPPPNVGIIAIFCIRHHGFLEFAPHKNEEKYLMRFGICCRALERICGGGK